MTATLQRVGDHADSPQPRVGDRTDSPGRVWVSAGTRVGDRRDPCG